MLAFANFSKSMKSSCDDKTPGKAGKDTVLDYSKQELSLKADFRDKVSCALIPIPSLPLPDVPFSPSPLPFPCGLVSQSTALHMLSPVFITSCCCMTAKSSHPIIDEFLVAKSTCQKALCLRNSIAKDSAGAN